MKVTFNVGWWVDIREEDKEVIFETADENGNEIELIFDKKGFFTKRHLKQLIKDLEKLSAFSKEGKK